MQHQSEFTTSNTSSSITYLYRHDPYDLVIARWYYGEYQEESSGRQEKPAFPSDPASYALPYDNYTSEADYLEEYDAQGWADPTNTTGIHTPASYYADSSSCYYNYPAVAAETDESVSISYDPSFLSSYYTGSSNSTAVMGGIESILCQGDALPEGTLHAALQERDGALDFVTYPTLAFENLEPKLPKSEMVCLFIGQLPRAATPMQLGWLAYTFGEGANLYHMEPIYKKIYYCRKARMEGKPSRLEQTGCYHAWCTQEDAAKFTNGVHGRVLIDDTGVWYCGGASASEEEQEEQLESYCNSLSSEGLPTDRPQRPVVVQPAISPQACEVKPSNEDE